MELAGPDEQVDILHGRDPAEQPGQPLRAEQNLAHGKPDLRRARKALTRLINVSTPSGNRKTMKMKKAPISRGHSVVLMLLTRCCSCHTTKVPMKAPNNVPRPPTATQTMAWVENRRPMMSGATKPAAVA